VALAASRAASAGYLFNHIVLDNNAGWGI